MTVARLREQVHIRRRRGLVFTVGGSADIILARCVAEGPMFPRRRELKLMDRRVLTEARTFLWEGTR